jgi:alkyldihydroxyacetonephosphate synthase
MDEKPPMNSQRYVGLERLLDPDRLSFHVSDIDAHSYDCWPVAVKWHQQGKQPHAPDAVAYPVSIEEIAAILAWATRSGIPVTPWGAGSSVTGAPLALRGGLMLDLSQMPRILHLDTHNLVVTVEAGVMGHDLEAYLNRHGYTLNHSPQSLNRSTVGGWVATRATGQFSSRWGGIEDLVVALTVVLADGEIVRTKATPRAAIGTDLKHLFIGSEGTLGVVAEVMLKIFPIAPYRCFEAVRFDDLEAGLTTLREITAAGLRPFLLRLYDADEARHAMKNSAFDANVLFIGCEGVQGVAEAEFAACRALSEDNGGQASGSAPVEAWMQRRFDFSTVENLLAQPGGVAETIEISHFWDGLWETYRRMKPALVPHAREVLGHFSHVYPQGSSLYMILLGEAADAAEAEAAILRFWDITMNICLETGAALSHHHGVGLARLPWIDQELGSGSRVLRALKAAIDPTSTLNPGKLVR